MDYATKGPRRHLRYWLGIGVAFFLTLYTCEYCRLRTNHDLVHDASGYTAENGKWVKTDRIDLGEWRGGPIWSAVYISYSPLRWIEGFYWQHQ